MKLGHNKHGITICPNTFGWTVTINYNPRKWRLWKYTIGGQFGYRPLGWLYVFGPFCYLTLNKGDYNASFRH